MTTFENHEVAINLELLKRLRFYRVLDPNGTKRFGRNVYWLGFLVANVIFRCLLVFTRDSGTFREHGRRSGREICNSPTDHYTNFKNILFNQLQLFLKTKSYYSVIWIIVIINVASNSIVIIVLQYVFLWICMSSKSYSIFSIVKLGSTVMFFIMQLFLYCYLFDNITTEIINVNFGIYSCNWTMMDIRVKHLVLLTMRLNDVNQLIMKVSPKKLIDKQLFSNVMTTGFNVVSVIYKTMHKKNK